MVSQLNEPIFFREMDLGKSDNGVVYILWLFLILIFLWVFYGAHLIKISKMSLSLFFF